MIIVMAVALVQVMLAVVIILWLLCNKTTQSCDSHVTPAKTKKLAESHLDKSDSISDKPHPLNNGISDKPHHLNNGISPAPHINNGSGLLGATASLHTLESFSDESLHTEVCFHGNNINYVMMTSSPLAMEQSGKEEEEKAEDTLK